MKVFLLIWVLFGDTQSSMLNDPIAVKYPTEDACAAMAEAINKMGDGGENGFFVRPLFDRGPHDTYTEGDDYTVYMGARCSASVRGEFWPENE